MSEQQLGILEAQAKADHAEADGDCSRCFGWTLTVQGLVAEVRRLRGLIADTCDRNGPLRNYGIELCPWCRTTEASARYHPPDCPVFTEGGDVR